MKIQCDVCGQQEAAVFCCADEAALCGPCDRSVHRANKLASKHRRFSLLRHPSLSPVCDICQEKKAFVFCQEDRAILCRDCDAPIHAANEHTKKHSRFLLTGVKLSLVPPASDPDNPSSSSSSSSSSTSTVADESDAPTTHSRDEKVVTHHQPAPTTTTTCGETMEEKEEQQLAAGSTISDYLIKTLPGWHVEDLLADAVPSPSVDVLSKMGIGDDLLPFPEGDRLPVPAWWVPQVPQVSSQGLQLCQGGGGGGGEMLSFGGGQQRWGGDDVFAVPQMVMPDQQRHQHGASNRRPRAMW